MPLSITSSSLERIYKGIQIDREEKEQNKKWFSIQKNTMVEMIYYLYISIYILFSFL